MGSEKMNSSIDKPMTCSRKVSLPHDYSPIWPDKCIECHNPSNSMTKTFWVEAPICKSCTLRYHFLWFTRWFIKYLILGGSSIFAFWLIVPYIDAWTGDYSRIYSRLAFGLIGVAIFSIWWLLRGIGPKFFSFTCNGEGGFFGWDKLSYNFLSQEYAEEFEKLNKSKVLKAKEDA